MFGEGYGFGETVLALLIHLIPTYLVVMALVIAWRWEWIGAAIYGALAVFFLLMSGGRSWGLSVPVFLVGFLFLLDWKCRIRSRNSRPPGVDTI